MTAKGKEIQLVPKQTEIERQQKEAQDDMFANLVESIIPLIQPLLKPASKKFEEFMNDDNLVLIRSVKGKVHIFHMKASDVEAFNLKDGKKAVGTYATDDFLAKLISGDFGK